MHTLMLIRANYVSLLQFDEQKDQVAVEQILRVVFLDVDRPSPVSHNYSAFISFSIAIFDLDWLLASANPSE